MKTEKTQGNLKRMWWIVGLIIIVIAAIFLVGSGQGEAQISIAPTGGSPSIYIDRTQQNALNPEKETTYSVSPGTRQVIISRDGYWPWTDEVDTEPNKTITLQPFLVQETPQSVLRVGESIQAALREAAASPVAASSSNALVSSDENMRIYVDSGSNLIAQWNQATSSAPNYLNCRGDTCGASVYNQAPITQLAFYPERHDVVIFATETGVYVIEIDSSGETQNFQPVSENLTNPSFTLSDGRIYVQSESGVTMSSI